jgi:hypothetical protein
VRAAVVVGCDGYGSANASLAGAVRDALAFWRWVCDPDGGGVTDDSARRLLLSPSDKGAAVPPDVTAGPADKGSFETALHEVVRDAGDQRERLYVYFAGHGFSVDDDFTVQGAIALADFDRNRTDNSIVVTDLLNELSFTGFAEQILIFDACRNIPFEGRLRAGRISRPFDRVPGVTQQFCALATTALNRTSDGTSTEDASFSGCLMRALAGDGAAKIWNEDANAYVVRWDQMFEYVTAALRSSVGDDRLPRQLGERDTGDPVLAQFAADHFPAINVALRVHPDDVRSASLVVHDPPDEHNVTWTAPGPATVSLVPRDYIVVASAEGLEPERRRWPLAAYTDSTVDITFVKQHTSRGADAAPPVPPGPTTFRAPDEAMAVSVALADGTRVEALGSAAPEFERSTTVVARVTAPDGRDGPPLRLRVLPAHSEEIALRVPPVDDSMRRFAERLELTPDGNGLVDVGGDTPAWPAPSSLLAMAWARPGFVPRRVLPPLPDARSEAVVVIASDIAVLLPADVVVDPTLQPFGEQGARRIAVDGRQLLVPNIAGRALIVDLAGSSPFASPAPITSDPNVARRVDLGYRYAASGRLRIGLELLAAAPDGDELAASMAELVTLRLDGDATGDDPTGRDAMALTDLTLGIGVGHPLLSQWVVAPHSAITVASIRATT